MQLSNRLNSWGNKYVSLDGRVVLINSVLNSTPIFYLYFLKVPSLILEKIVCIQREFLWGGVRGGRKTCWVKWRKVCQPRSKGGLSINVKRFNLSLLAKWKWRLISDDQSLWKRVLLDKYGVGRDGRMGLVDVARPRWMSKWWERSDGTRGWDWN